MKVLRLLLPIILGCSPPTHAGEEIIKDQQGMDCHVYTPDQMDPAVIYQLVVGVHGAGRSNGAGAAGMAGWTKRGDVIVIGPAFETKGAQPYQGGDGVHAEKLIRLFKELGSRYKLRDKMFIHGFSGGSQFAHRFAMNHPELVCGVSAHSGGSWATDNYGSINTRARKIPFAISCGEKDTGKAWGDAPFTRIDWFGRFRDEIDKKGFCYAADTWPDVGHGISSGVWQLCKECFQLATGLPGESATNMVEISQRWKNLENAPGRKVEPAAPTAAYVDPSELAKMTRSAFQLADEGEIADDKLVSFMTRYPPILWKDQPGADKLLKQCVRAASAWRRKAIETNGFHGHNQEAFEKFSKGLELPPPSR